MKAKVTQTGDEFVIRFPARMGHEHGLSDGQIVEINPRRLVPSLEEMFAEMDRLGPANRPEPVDWGPDVGAEIIDDDWSR
ncbi:MazF family transcriptional regulator [Methylobacterium sp. E-045]|uniref:AbrB/MazE/SpoVT family DNA-binding domain-containing protein n=1 Tax=Methylobacterium sp. E-045 TaxID=2836575 RepID=UPI001FBB900A|nr:MazF family transcriptional regulator [Methylobacterium sp. E-045]MCJ2130493.1 MazF family transcriptional regulator [Methylobacterium sp. E-045]